MHTARYVEVFSKSYLSNSVINTNRRSVRKTWGKWNVGQFGLEANVRRASCAPFLQSFHQVALTLVVKFLSQIKQRHFCISIWSFLHFVHLTCGLCLAESSIKAFCSQLFLWMSFFVLIFRWAIISLKLTNVGTNPSWAAMNANP